MSTSTETLPDYHPQEVIHWTDFYDPWPKQRYFHEAMVKHRLQIGSYGSGKSRPLLMEAIIVCQENPGVNAIILRKTMPDLKRTVIDKFEADVPLGVYERGSQEKGTFNKSDHIVYFPPQWVPLYNFDIDKEEWVPILNPSDGTHQFGWKQSKLYFAACEKEKDIGKYLSTEYAFIGFEELGEFPYVIYDAMEGRNRSTVPGVVPRMGAATNPMGVGWSWIKRIFIDKVPCQGMDKSKYNKADYCYIHSTIDDNPILIRDKAYVNSLEKSPLAARIRWGKLDATTGQYYDNWEEERHVRPASDFRFEDWQPVWIGWDYGFGHYATMIFMTKAWLKPRFDGDKEKIVNVVLREVYLEEKTPEEQVAALIAAIPRMKDKDGDDAGYAWNVESIHFSWERFNRVSSNRTIAQEVTDMLQAAGLPPVTRSNNDRVAGWTKIYSMLEGDELFLVRADGLHRGAPELAEAIPLLVRGNGVTVSLEDVVKPDGKSLVDDLGDALRYAVAGVLLDAEDKPDDVKLREKLAGIKDPMARHVAAYKDYVAHNKPKPPVGPSIPSWVNKVRGR
jgi:Phage terminase large subunit